MKDYASADDWYIDQDRWFDEVALLRSIVLGMGLTETLKWKHPCYTDTGVGGKGKNIVIISWMKGTAVASFMKGALLEDPRGRLEQPGQERSGRYMAFTDVAQIEADRDYLCTLVTRAIEVERAGLEVEPLPDSIDYIDELVEHMRNDAVFRAAFERLTPGRRRHYNLHFGEPKRSSTRLSRIAQCTERILMGKGLRDCVCGLSQRPPGCDGSHRGLG